MLRRPIVAIAAAISFALVAFGTNAADTKREITHIAGDLYRFQNDFHFSVFLVTPEGVIVSDPINTQAATWLKAEIAARFDKPIKYMIYSHHHADHVSGGEVFADEGVTIIAHENAARGLKERSVPTAPPTETFSDTKTIELGGKTVELIYLGPSHSDDLIIAHFPDERTVFAVDFVSVKRLPYKTLLGSYWPGWIEALDKLAAMDFDVLAPGHGAMGGPQDVADHAQYLRDLHAAVSEGVAAGKSLAELQSGVTMEKYKHWGQYDAWLKENVEGMLQHAAQ